MTMQIHAILDNANHNTANTSHPILAAVTWPSCHCVNSRHIWHISTKIWVNRQIIMKTTQSTLTRIRPMQDAVICADRRTESYDEGNRLLHFVRMCLKMLYSSKFMILRDMPFSCIYFRIFIHYQVLEIPLLTSQISRITDCQIYAHLCCGVLCGTGNRAVRHLLPTCVQTVTVSHSVRLVFTEVQI